MDRAASRQERRDLNDLRCHLGALDSFDLDCILIQAALVKLGWRKWILRLAILSGFVALVGGLAVAIETNNVGMIVASAIWLGVYTTLIVIFSRKVNL